MGSQCPCEKSSETQMISQKVANHRRGSREDEGDPTTGAVDQLVRCRADAAELALKDDAGFRGILDRGRDSGCEQSDDGSGELHDG